MKPFKLDEIEKIKSGFNEPEGYFDDFSIRLLEKIAHQPSQRKKYLSIYTRKAIAIAAMLLLAFGLAFVQYYKAPKNDQTDESIENYLASNQCISNEDWAMMLDEKDLQKMEKNINLNNQEIEDILSSEENFENYIID
ncbi:hypothetical protein KIH23_12230 [Flavobacterium sp. CYK-55]|uniref:hypothetical protein n=1 Tax=Flavobacterium sp. CYK-55 TaxID=2835529 RepID=UPI001BCE15C9|nr:hypothetical protein [Flavobacterium sp. CYK-55]MBS7788066.1 hypothetical protein [Flavobacterium sp. CYK-55]